MSKNRQVVRYIDRRTGTSKALSLRQIVQWLATTKMMIIDMVNVY